MSITALERPAVTTPAFTHLPWCVEHWDDDPGQPGPCFADDLTIPFREGEIEVAMSAIPGSGADPTLTLFLASKDSIDGPSFPNLAEAEVAAWSLLAMVARARGDLNAAAQHAYAAHLAAAARCGEAGS